LINVIIYVFVYFSARLYAEVSLQLYYLVVSIYGWYYWQSGKTKNKGSGLNITVCSRSLILKLSVIFVALFFLMAFVLKKYTNTDVPFVDAFVTALSFIATWLLAKKKIENWLVWIVVDASCIGVYIYKGLYPTIVLFAVLTVLAFVGYNSWKKSMKCKNE
jgi:nicotinamide mononucleotide transporter